MLFSGASVVFGQYSMLSGCVNQGNPYRTASQAVYPSGCLSEQRKGQQQNLLLAAEPSHETPSIPISFMAATLRTWSIRGVLWRLLTPNVPTGYTCYLTITLANLAKNMLNRAYPLTTRNMTAASGSGQAPRSSFQLGQEVRRPADEGQPGADRTSFCTTCYAPRSYAD